MVWTARTSLSDYYREITERTKSNLPGWLTLFLQRIKRSMLLPFNARGLLQRRAEIRKYTNSPRPIVYKGVSFSIIVNPKNGLIDQTIALKGTWEEHILDCLSTNLKPGDVFLDIGANIGMFSLFGAKLVSTEGKVISCEPIPRLADQLRKSAKLNSLHNILVHTVACSNENGTATLHERPDNIGGSTLRHVNKDNLFIGSRAISVKTVKLDEYLEDCEQKIDFIKIDVEGYELHALRGMIKIIERNKPILLIEFSPEFYATMTGNIQQEIVSFLRERGYRFFSTSRQEVDVTELLAMTRQRDILCVA